MTQVLLPDEVATSALAGRLAAIAKARDVLALWGGLGVGKTAFARSFVRARSSPFVEVPSPTFTLVQIYPGAPAFAAPVYHFDLFRICAAEEALELGLDDAFAEGVSLIEWPDRLGALLPAGRLDITLEWGPGPESRQVSFTGNEDWRRRLTEAGLA